jgi:hypothetical protein
MCWNSQGTTILFQKSDPVLIPFLLARTGINNSSTPNWVPTQSWLLWGHGMATVNQHPPVHHDGWMVSGQETAFCSLGNHGVLAQLLLIFLYLHKQVISG